MNEITQIHLGRQAFTISVEAHQQLRDYLARIGKQVGGDKDVLEEVELRMAELLVECGISGDKVVLPQDVEYLYAQLGAPSDFGDDANEAEPAGETAGKRLFRDTDNAMLAGVSSGLAAYLGVDTAIVRLVFVLLALMSGTGVIIYLILWLVVPEAKTSSERLQMHGKAVTVDSLKSVIDRADVPAAAGRARRSVGRPIEKIFRFVLTLIGVGVVAFAGAALLWLLTTTIFLLLGQGKIAGEVLLPVGTHEIVGLIAVAIAGSIALLSLVLIGLAMIRRKWQLSGWIVASLVGVFMLSAAVGGALTAQAVPDIQSRFQALHRETERSVPAGFHAVELRGSNTRYVYQPDSQTYLEISHLGKTDTKRIDTTSQNGVLTIDTTEFVKRRDCSLLCLYSDNDLQVTIHAPKLDRVVMKGGQNSFAINEKLNQDTLSMSVERGDDIHISYLNSADVVMTTSGKDSTMWQIDVSGIMKDSYASDTIDVDAYSVYIAQTGGFTLITGQKCDESMPLAYVPGQEHVHVTINGKLIENSEQLRSLHSSDEQNAYNCVALFASR